MKRLALVLLVASLAGSALLVGSARASSMSACGSKVIADWYDNGRIDHVYPIPCYRQALQHLPLDVQEYADAHDVISRAMAAALVKPSRVVGPPTGTDTTGTDTTQTTTTNVSPAGPGGGDGNPPASTKGPDPLLTKALKRLGPSSANSIPLPLVVLGALALLLLAAGAAGVVARKLQERRLPPGTAGRGPARAPSASLGVPSGAVPTVAVPRTADAPTRRRGGGPQI